MTDAGFDIVEGTHPIVPVMLGDAAVSAALRRAPLGARRLRDQLLVPGRAPGHGRIRTQLSAAHSFEDIDFAVAQFVAIKDELSL